jgi:hypothetical protein
MVERRTRYGIAEEEPLDRSRRSPLLVEGLDYSRHRRDEIGPPQPAETWRPLAGSSANNRGAARIVRLETLDSTGGPAPIPEILVPSIVQSQRGEGQFDGELISVRLGISLPEPMLDATGASPYATIPLDIVCRLEFGIGGVSYTAEVDWNLGTVFGVSASFVRVNARIAPIPALLVPVPPIDFVLQASLAYGDASNTGISAEARRTINVGNLDGLIPAFPLMTTIVGGGLSAVFPIPVWTAGLTLTDAGALIGGFLPGVPVAPDYTIFLFDANGQVSVEYTVSDRTNFSQTVEGHFPVPVQSRFIRVRNNLGVPMISPRIIFNLAL